MAEERTHVPLGADVELYRQMSEWAPGIAGFLRFDIGYDTAGAIGPPGVDLVTLARGDAVLQSYLFVVEPFDVNGTTGYITLTGMDDYAQSFGLDSLNDWQGYDYASIGEGLFGVRDPLVFRTPTLVRFYYGDNQGDDPGATAGEVTLVLRVLPAPAEYPA